MAAMDWHGRPSFISTAVAAAMTWSSLSLVLIGFDPGKRIAFIPVQLAAVVLPVGFALITARFVVHAPIAREGASRAASAHPRAGPAGAPSLPLRLGGERPGGGVPGSADV